MTGMWQIISNLTVTFEVWKFEFLSASQGDDRVKFQSLYHVPCHGWTGMDMSGIWGVLLLRSISIFVLSKMLFEKFAFPKILEKVKILKYRHFPRFPRA